MGEKKVLVPDQQILPPAKKPGLDALVPSLTEKQTRSRAVGGFDSAVEETIKSIGRELPQLKAMVVADQKSLPADASSDARQDALMLSIKKFREQNPDSVLALYLKATENKFLTETKSFSQDPEKIRAAELDAAQRIIKTFKWSWAGSKVSITFELDAQAVKSWLKQGFDIFRTRTIDAIVGTQQNDQYLFMKGMDSYIAKRFSENLANEFNDVDSKNWLPVKITYTYGRPPSSREVPLPPGVSEFEDIPYMKMEYTLPRRPKEISIEGRPQKGG